MPVAAARIKVSDLELHNTDKVKKIHFIFPKANMYKSDITQ